MEKRGKIARVGTVYAQEERVMSNIVYMENNTNDKGDVESCDFAKLVEVTKETVAAP